MAVNKLCWTRQQFIWFMHPLEDFVVYLHQFARGIISAQVSLETAYGKAIIDHNLFNIKATKSWNGDVEDILTTEYVDGVPKKMYQKFRAYNSYFDSVKDYLKLLKLKRYETAWTYRGNPELFFKGLVLGGYATDPKYAQSLMTRYRILRQVENGKKENT